jgi:RNA polymerase sigma-70 factor (ECF subfamily)
LSTLHKTTEEIEAERALVKKAQEDPLCFAPLYERYYKPIFIFVHRRTDNEDLSADLTSQVFMKALSFLHTYQHKGLPFSAWLFRIAFNEVNMYFRKHKNSRSVCMDDHQVVRIAEEMGDGDLEEKIDRILQALQTLSMEELPYIELRFFEERSFKEIAMMMNITENNAKVKTYRIIDKLKKQMGF